MEQSQPKLKVVNGHVYATSLEVAKRFNKAHKNVLRDIQNIISQSDLGLPNDGFSRLNFEPSEHLDGFNDGRNWHVYQDSFDTFLRLRRGSVAKAA